MAKPIDPILPLKIIIILFLSILLCVETPEPYKAAKSYTDAKAFYESTALYGESYHAEMINGTVYYATCAKKATISMGTVYRTLGFDMGLSVGHNTPTASDDHYVGFSVVRGGSYMKEISSVSTDTHQYILYAIDDATLYDLAMASNAEEADYILSAPEITVTMNAIITTVDKQKVNGIMKESYNGTLKETGCGTVEFGGTEVYCLWSADHLKMLKKKFPGHTFESYRNIKETLKNPLLTIQFHAEEYQSTSSTKATVQTNSGFEINNEKGNEFLLQDGKLYRWDARVLDIVKFISPESIGLSKLGYHLPVNQGIREDWITSEHPSRKFRSDICYRPKDIDMHIGVRDNTITVYANWKPNTYTISYHANGGSGLIKPTNCTFDETVTLRNNIFTRTGYTLKKGAEWNTKPDGSGKSYSSSEVVSNLTHEHLGNVTLYANWEANIMKITLDKQKGSGGTNTFYQQYGVGFFSDAKCKNKISTITLPSLKGRTCTGYYAEITGMGKQLIHASGNNMGNFTIENTYFSDDCTIYADYRVNTYTITFNKQGGKANIGTNTTTAMYGDYFPEADGPVRGDYTFKGYYQYPNGQGIQYYNEHMASDKRYLLTDNLTVYAHWVDETKPAVTLKAIDKWTNQTITLTAAAMDNGDGLKSVIIYRIAEDGSLSAVASNTACNGKPNIVLTYNNPSEGIVRYKVVATDMSENNLTAEAVTVVYYDITKPQGEILDSHIDNTKAFFKVNVTDVNIQ